MTAANAYVATEYLPQHNARFAIAPANPVDHHRPRDRRRWADADVFCREPTRVVGNDFVVQYQTQALHLDPRRRGRVPAKSQVLVRELRDGTLRVVSVAPDGRERVIPWTPAAPRLPKAKAVISPSAAPPPPASPTTTPGRWIPAPTHPWREQHRRWQEQARARKTHREAATGPLR